MISGWIVTAPAPGMAAADAFTGFPHPAPGPIFFNRVDGVLAACWSESALPAEEAPERYPIKKNDLNQEPAHRDIVARLPVKCRDGRLAIA
jgi:hypothetical protein